MGNVTLRKDHFQNLHEDMIYDNLNRLDTVTTHFPWGNLSTNMTYDSLGNIKSKSDVGSYKYGQNTCGLYAGPHAVTETYNGPYLSTYCYDSNGNMTQRDISGGARTNITWTTFNKPKSMVATDGTDIRFEYGPNRNRFRQVRKTANGDTQTTIYLPEFERIQNKTSIVRKYYVDGYGVVTKQAGKDDKIHFLLKDPLGSTTTVLDSVGNVVERMSFDVWGKRRKGDWSPVASNDEFWYASVTTRGYTGHEMLDALNLVHMNGRIFDPVIARFMSADPLIQAPSLLASYNRYSYVMNNPLFFTDPSGYSWVSDKWKDIRKIAVTAIGAYVGSLFGCPGCFMNGFTAGLTGAFTTHTYRHAKDKGASTGSAFKMAAKVGITQIATAYAAHSIGIQVPFEKNPVLNLTAHGLVGAVAAGINGGNPRDGFISSFVGAGVGKALKGTPLDPQSSTIAAGVVAAAVAEMTGGDPYLAAGIAVMQHAYNARGMGKKKKGFLQKVTEAIFSNHSAGIGEGDYTATVAVAGGGILGGLARRLGFRSASTTAGSVRGVNPSGSMTNCVNCSLAVDATLAGSATSALPGAATSIRVLERYFSSNFSNAMSSASLEQIMLNAGHGARGIVFGSRGSQTGHVFNVVNQRGVLRFIDGQAGGAASLNGYRNFKLLRTN